jgi:tRNA1(Val) A37 N6-methylase TrmN6
VVLRGEKLEPKRLQFVYPRMGEEAKFILIESIKTSGVELKLMEPLILHGIQ